MKPLLLIVLAAGLAQGQCVMCFRNAEAQNTARAGALNRGILVLLLPALSGMGLIAALAWRRR